MSDNPSINGSNGRDERGRFAVGNAGGPGNPHVKKVQQLRSALLNATTARDVRAIVKRLISMARDGDVPAARLLLERVFGPAVSIDYESRLIELEAMLEGRDRP